MQKNMIINFVLFLGLSHATVTYNVSIVSPVGNS